MSNLKASENATVVKARAIYGKHLTHSDYIELASQKKVTDAAEYLKKNTYFADALANIDTSTIHRGFLESILHKEYFDRYESLCRFQGLDDKPFFNFLFVRSEIRELLKALLYLNNDNNDIYIESMYAHLIEKSCIDLIALAKASNFKEVLNVLRHTPYYDVLKGITPDSDGNIPYTKCEVKLRTYYLKWMLESTEKVVHGEARKILSDQIKAQTDVINLINAYRMKKYFNADRETLEKYVLPFYGKLSKEKQSALFETQSVEDYLRMFSQTSYGRKIKDFSEDMNSDQFEKELISIRYDMAKRALMFSQDAAVSVYSLMYLLEVELDNIINIIEGIRYNKSVSYMENLIVVK